MLLQYLIVALVVLLAASYAGARYLPRTWRQRLVFVLTRGSGKGKVADWLGGADAGCGSGCGSCGTCEPAAPMPERDAQGRKVIKLHVR